jgi:integrase
MENEFKSNLTDLLKDKGLSDSSISLYLRNLEKLNGNLPLKNFNFLNNLDYVKEMLNKYKPNTQRAYYIAIVSCLGVSKDDKKAVKLYSKYYKLMNDKAKEIKETPTEDMTETQKKNWLDWEDVMTRFNELSAEVLQFSKNKDISPLQYISLLSYMTLALYVFLPPRRNMDYQKMNIVKKYTESLPIDRNYLSLDDGELIFNVYKTAKSMGQTKVKIPDDLMKVIMIYLKFHPLIKGKLKKDTNVSFLVNFEGQALTNNNSITRILNKIFSKDKKLISSSMLRHIFLTKKYGENLKERENDAVKMGHSVATQGEYIKDDKKKIQVV